jgi:hypothetical protein
MGVHTFVPDYPVACDIDGATVRYFVAAIQGTGCSGQPTRHLANGQPEPSEAGSLELASIADSISPFWCRRQSPRHCPEPERFADLNARFANTNSFILSSAYGKYQARVGCFEWATNLTERQLNAPASAGELFRHRHFHASDVPAPSTFRRALGAVGAETVTTAPPATAGRPNVQSSVRTHRSWRA